MPLKDSAETLFLCPQYRKEREKERRHEGPRKEEAAGLGPLPWRRGSGGGAPCRPPRDGVGESRPPGASPRPGRGGPAPPPLTALPPPPPRPPSRPAAAGRHEESRGRLAGPQLRRGGGEPPCRSCACEVSARRRGGAGRSHRWRCLVLRSGVCRAGRGERPSLRAPEHLHASWFALRIRSGAGAQRSDFRVRACGFSEALSERFAPFRRPSELPAAPALGGAEKCREAVRAGPNLAPPRPGRCLSAGCAAAKGGRSAVRCAVRCPSAALRSSAAERRAAAAPSIAAVPAARASDVHSCLTCIAVTSSSCCPGSLPSCAARIVALVACSLSQFQLLAPRCQRRKIPEGSHLPGLALQGCGCQRSAGRRVSRCCALRLTSIVLMFSAPLPDMIKKKKQKPNNLLLVCCSQFSFSFFFLLMSLDLTTAVHPAAEHRAVIGVQCAGGASFLMRGFSN